MSETERDRAFLAELQALPTSEKVMRSIGLIGEWNKYFDGKVYVSLSGGKDSTVLADLVGYWMAAIKKPLNLCFSNTGLEYPEIQRHVKELRDYLADKHHIEVNLDVVRPKINFSEVISTYGYPLISKEVSEAIYYARRIRKPDENTNRKEALNGSLPPRERERERERDGAAICLTRGIGLTKTILRKRSELNGKRKSTRIAVVTVQESHSLEHTRTDCLSITEDNSEAG